MSTSPSRFKLAINDWARDLLAPWFDATKESDFSANAPLKLNLVEVFPMSIAVQQDLKFKHFKTRELWSNDVAQ